MVYRSLVFLFLAGIFWMPASVLAQDEIPPETPGMTIHVVQRGENLFRIALAYGLSVDEIARVNGITNVANILVGQRLLIPLDVPVLEPVPLLHTVQAGESLSSIAQAYGTTAENLAVLNELANINAIYVGQVLRVGSESPETEAPPPSEVQALASIVHYVVPGETLFRIALRYGLTVVDLQSANEISDPSLIYSGQELIIPGVRPPQLALDLPPEITSLDIEPLILVEGQAARIRLVTPTSAVVTLNFLDIDAPVIADARFIDHVAFLPVPVGTEPGIYPLQVDVLAAGSPPANLTVNVQVVGGGYSSQYITLPEDRVALLSPAVEENEMNILRTAAGTVTPERFFNGAMSLPAAAAMNSPFGTRRAYNGGPFDRFHNGADFAGAPGSPVRAAAPGRVVLADTLNIRGVSLMIDHGWGVFTVYAHLSDRNVQLGDFVNTGQLIGSVGSTGRATGAHLHWELWVNGVPVDPLQWVRQNLLP